MRSFLGTTIQLFALLGSLAFVVVGAIVGARLLLLARRTRKLPEVYVGGALFLYSVVTQPSILANRAFGEAFGRGASVAALAVGLTALVLTFLGVYLFTWVVFRRGSKTVLASVCVAVGLAAVAAGGVIFSIAQHEVGAPYSTLTKLSIAALALNFTCSMGWTAWESLHYRARLSKQLALGLADPVIVNRFGIWGFGCLTCSVASALMIGFVAAGQNVGVDPLPMLSTAVAGITIAACWYLSFLPPQRYLHWVRARAERHGRLSSANSVSGAPREPQSFVG